VRRNGTLIAGDIQQHIERFAPLLNRKDSARRASIASKKAERVVPKMQATIAFVSGYVAPAGASMRLDAAGVLRHACSSPFLRIVLERVASRGRSQQASRCVSWPSAWRPRCLRPAVH